MKQPTYKPEAWVLYEEGTGGGYGRVTGANFDGESWVYTVSGALADGSLASVREEDIKQVLQNGSWLTITNAAASSSAYQDQNQDV